MNEFLREELANILRESPLPDILDPGIEQSLAEAKLLLQVVQPAGSQTDTWKPGRSAPPSTA